MAVGKSVMSLITNLNKLSLRCLEWIALPTGRSRALATEMTLLHIVTRRTKYAHIRRRSTTWRVRFSVPRVLPYVAM